MRKLNANQVRQLTAALDQAAEYLERGHQELGLPEKLALQCAYRLDKVADRVEGFYRQASRQAAENRRADVIQHDADEWYDMFYDHAGDQGPSDHLHIEPDEASWMNRYREDTQAETMRRRESPTSTGRSPDQGISQWGTPFRKQPSQHIVDNSALRSYEPGGPGGRLYQDGPPAGGGPLKVPGGRQTNDSTYVRYTPVTHAGVAVADEDLI